MTPAEATARLHGIRQQPPRKSCEAGAVNVFVVVKRAMQPIATSPR